VSQFDRFIADLHGQLARWRKNQRLRATYFASVLQVFQNGDHKSGRFAGSRASLADDIHTFECEWYHPRLDWRGLQIPRLSKRIVGSFRETKILKSRGRFVSRGFCQLRSKSKEGGFQ